MPFPRSDVESKGKKKLNNKVDLLGTAKFRIEKEEDQEKTMYSLKISGRGEEDRYAGRIKQLQRDYYEWRRV